MTLIIGRRKLLAALGGAAAWPFAARAQQPMPVIGYIGTGPREAESLLLSAFREGLNEAGYVEGRNVALEYRWADYQFDRLPELAADLVRQRVAVIVTSGGPAPTLAAKAATTTIPIVFIVGADPVKLGLVASLARPGGNLTGVNFFAFELVAKRLELLRQLIPGITRVAALVNLADAAIADATAREVETAAGVMGLHVQLLNASTSGEINAAFANFARERPDALLVSPGSMFLARRVQLTQLATKYAIPAIYGGRAYAEAGGLMSYGTNLTVAFRQVGIYAGRILKGAKPADLPVEQSTKFELVINRQTARMLGLTVPDKMLALADEVIE
jgi:putative tryptophan/tyrosine transport system substrate-binding protein